MICSGTLSKLIPALIKAKANFAPAVKNKKNDFFKSKYVPLDAVIDVTEGALLAEGLVVVQTTRSENGANLLVTTLIHESGEFISGEYLLKSVKDDPQGYGSAMTYARRYCMMAILGIAPEDDDGHAASNPGSPAASVNFGKTPAEKAAAKSQAEANAKLVAAGATPVTSIDEKQAAVDAYKLLDALEPELAKSIKHQWGTDYAKMKEALLDAHRDFVKGAK